ncbi:hypothetical protein [Halobaculum litoreum]|uniref:1,4-dihydroxy-2-naphthoate octaprenyltransferase n=1 Tax=Halobaculum litoreum TaxID=3031998 RepID=A0ABD5XS59_9EURY|nr:hypothetical protein [Halobaculum sp. DT92]
MSPSNTLPSVASLRESMSTPTDVKNLLAKATGTGKTAAVVPIRAAAFYVAIGLPLVYLPLLAGGVTPDRFAVLLGLLLANAAALVLGHDYGANRLD